MAVCNGVRTSPAGCVSLVHQPQQQQQQQQQQHQPQQPQHRESKNVKLPLLSASGEGVGGGGGSGGVGGAEVDEEIEVDQREVYFLIMHFLSSGPCNRATGQLWNELLQHKLLPRRFHAIYSRNGSPNVDENDDGSSFPLSYVQVTERFKHIERNHLVKLLQQLLVHDRSASLLDASVPRPLTAADVPTLLGSGPFSLLESEQRSCPKVSAKYLEHLRWPHWQAHQVHALALREIGGGFAKHHRAASIRTPNHVIVKPSVLVERIRITKLLRGHRNAVYCAVFDRTGRFVVTGSDDRLVKIWSAESGLCLRGCRGHEGDITDLSVSHASTLVASASNDSTIRIWRLPDGAPVSVLRGHTAGVTAIEFSPRQGCEHHLLSSSEDGTCRIWDARDSSVNSRVYMPKPPDPESAGAENVTAVQTGNQILCCAFNADGSFFVTGSSDKLARVWDARRWSEDVPGRPNHELDILSGHENVVNYVRFSGCAEPTKVLPDTSKEDNLPRFKNSWFAQDSIVTCSKDGTAIIWTPRPRKQVKLGRWVKAYHLKVPPPPMPQPPARAAGPRQRLAPTPRGVNMITWSLDNRFVLAAIMDCRICVWNAVDGSLVHCLTGHSKQTFVLDVHPSNPRIAMSAGYDGRVIIWDIWEGRPLRTYETGDYNLVDGNFSPDGMSFVVSDEVGQIYLFSIGTGSSQQDAKYDQFFLGDYRPLVRDTHGNVLDQETQLPPHQRNLQDLLCDASMIPYPEPYQSSYQQRRFGALGIDWRPPSLDLAVGTLDDPAYIPELPLVLEPVAPAVVVVQANGQGNRWVEQPADADVMDWEEESDDSGSDYCASEESLSDDDGNESASHTNSESEPEDIDFEDGVRRSRSHRNKRITQEVVLVEKQAKRRLDDSGNSTPEQSSKRRRFRSGKQSRTSDSEGSRPMRVAARNALSMFSSLHDEEEDEGAKVFSQRTEGPSTSGENQRILRNGKAVVEPVEKVEAEASQSVKETTEAADCRRPRSQRKLVLKIKTCTQPTQALEGSVTDTCRPQEADEAGPLESDSKSLEENEFKRKQPRRTARGSRFRYDPSSSESAERDVHDDEDTKEGNESASPPHSGLKTTLKAMPNGSAKPWDDSSGQTEPAIVSDSEKSLSADYLEEHKRRQNQTATSNDSVQNGGEDADNDPDNDPDYHDEPSPASNSEDAYKPDKEEASDELDVEASRRRRYKAVYTRRNKKPVDRNNHVDEAGPSNGRRRSSRLAQGSQARQLVVPSRMSTRNKGKVRRQFNEDSETDEDSDWDRRNGSVRRTSTRLKGKLVNSRYRDFHAKRNQEAVRRSPGNVSWLLLTEIERTRYIPQFGDRVVYLRQGHQDYVENKDLGDDGPWKMFKGELRAVEFCEVTELEYIILPDTGNTCCQLSLKFTEGYRKRGRSFNVTLPELTDFADFIVERNRYEASISRNWSNRDKCKVWWRSDDEEGGSWWEGRVTQVKAKSPEYPDSPWDSISVQYKDEPQSTQHSPWELHDIDDTSSWAQPSIDEEETKDLLEIVDEVLKSNQSKDEYGLWRLQQAVSKPDFLDRIPLPVSMDVIRTRLEKNYYRSIEALGHDLTVLIDNFRNYFGKDHSSVLKVERLRERFSHVLSD